MQLGPAAAQPAHDRTRSALQDRGLLPPGCVVVLLVGSRARGWDHARSDTDLVVVVPDTTALPETRTQPVRLEPGTITVWEGTVDGRRHEVKYWTTGQVEQALRKVGWQTFGAEDAGEDLSENEFDLLQRLPHAVPLLGADWLAAVAQQVRASALSSRTALAVLTRADSELEDLSGLWDSGDLEAAAISAHRAYVAVVDALMASRGEHGLEAKWRARRVAAAGGSVLTPEQFWSVQTMRGYDPDRPQRWLDEVSRECSRLLLEVVLGPATDPDSEPGGALTTGATTPTAGGRAVAPPPHVRVRNMSGSIMLAVGDDAVELSGVAEDIWRGIVLDVDLSDTAAAIAQAYGVADEEVLADAQGWVRDMVARGFLRRSSAAG